MTRREALATAERQMSGLAANTRTIDIAVIGATGRVGRRVLELVAQREPAWRAIRVRPRIVAVANSRAQLLAADGLDARTAADSLLAAAPGPAADLASRCRRRPDVVIDCSASAAVAALYPRWLAGGSDVVTPNKAAGSGTRALVAAIAAARLASGARLYDATTVGAQLPLLATLRDLHAAGDRIERFEAVLSGTLSYVLGAIERGAPLSAAVRDAVQAGYAEPNPARDLSGEDAARKLVILLRALGHDVELGDIECVPLVDTALLEATDPARVLARLAEADAGWRARVALAQARRERWVYRASFADGRARVAPERVAADDALARLAPCENALILSSQFYRAAPLTIAGPGAGIDLTAASVFAELVDAAERRAAGARQTGAATAAAAA